MQSQSHRDFLKLAELGSLCGLLAGCQGKTPDTENTQPPNNYYKTMS